MASNSNINLKSAADAVNDALARLEAAAELAAHERAQSAQVREDTQAKITANWQSKYNALELELNQTRTEATQLREENQKLSNQLQQLSQEHVELQNTAAGTVSRLNASVSQLDLLLEQTA